jgi:GTP-binding protein HflX
VPKEEDDLTPMTRENYSLEDLQKTWMARLGSDCIFISAKKKTNLDELKEKVYVEARRIHTERYPYDDLLYVDVEEDAE